MIASWWLTGTMVASLQAGTPAQIRRYGDTEGHNWVGSVANQAAARFWQQISDFAVSHVKPPRVFRYVPSSHPFLSVQGDKLVTRLPVSVEFP